MAAPTTSTTTTTQPKGAGKGVKGQGRGKVNSAPAINPNNYAGYCYKSGRWGYISTACRATVSAVFDKVLDDWPIANIHDKH
eukprot:6531802-Heterocapsa_arctica.AAC.1